MSPRAPWYLVELHDARGCIVSQSEVQGLAPAKLELLAMQRDPANADAVRGTIHRAHATGRAVGAMLVDVRKPAPEVVA